MNIKKISLTGMLAALIFVFTMFVKIPVFPGYVHLGDALIYIGALILGAPYAIIAGAIGEGLADIAGGYLIYAPATIVIKALIALPFIFIRNKEALKLFSLKSVLCSIISGIITVLGYFSADLIIAKAYAFADIPINAVQAVGSVVAFILLAVAIDKTKLLGRINI